MAARTVQGAMNGNIGITKVAMSDMTDETNVASGAYWFLDLWMSACIIILINGFWMCWIVFSFIPLVWGLGVIVG